MIKKYRNHTADQPQHCEEEPHNFNTNSHKTS